MNWLNHYKRTLYQLGTHLAHLLSRKQWALVISTCILGVFLILSYQLELKSLADEILIELAIEEPEEAPKEEPIKEKEELQELEPKTNKAYNTSLKETFATPPAVKSNPKALEKTAIDLKEGALEGIASDFELKLRALQANNIQDRIDSIGIPDEVNNYKKDTRIWYSLANRTHRKIAVPIYMCNLGGKVAINILVSPAGNVIETSVNAKNSTTNNGCLIDVALQYAQKTTFLPGKNGNQWGVIYYLFSKR